MRHYNNTFNSVAYERKWHILAKSLLIHGKLCYLYNALISIVTHRGCSSNG
jgi:hypothetical protein